MVLNPLETAGGRMNSTLLTDGMHFVENVNLPL